MISVSKKIIPLLIFLMTICFTANAQKFDRGLNYSKIQVFMPERQFIFGGTVSYQNWGFHDFKYLLLDNINLNAYSLKATPYIYFSFYRNMAAGIRFSYERAMADIKATDIVLNKDMQLNLDDIYGIEHIYYGSLSYRYYVPLFQSKIFALFSDIAFKIGAGQGKLISGRDGVMEGTYQKIFNLGVDVTPGMIFFVSNAMAIEASVEILNIGWRRINQISNQIYRGRYDNTETNFKINFLSINIGVDFVIPLKKS